MQFYREEIANAGLDKTIGQYFAALTNMRSVGVMGDEKNIRLRHCTSCSKYCRFHDSRSCRNTLRSIDKGNEQNHKTRCAGSIE